MSQPGKHTPVSTNFNKKQAMENAILLLHLRKARIKAMQAAILEASILLEDLGATPLSGGPMGDKAGVFSLELPDAAFDEATDRLPRLGYINAVDMLDFDVPVPRGKKAKKRKPPLMWRRQPFELLRLYVEDSEVLREKAPDRRVFILPSADGTLRAVKGYRGDGGATSRRALPVADCRLLVNLVHQPPGSAFLDPFAGAGGIVIEAIESGYRSTSVDIDPILQHGLKHFGAEHYVANARSLPFSEGTFDAIATEVPFDENITPLILAAVEECHRVLSPSGRISMMVAEYQADAVRKKATALGLRCYLDILIDRKGLPVSILAWDKRAPGAPILRGPWEAELAYSAT